YSLTSMIKFFILKNILGISTFSTLLRFLSLSKELRDFCEFDDLPHASQISRFCTRFSKEVNQILHVLVEITQPMLKEIDPFLSSILISDTTGFEVYVKENNPKFYANLLRISKNFGKLNDIENFNPEKYAQSQYPKYAYANPEIPLSYLNSHFGFFVKSNIVTDGLGIIRHIDFYDEEMDFSLNPNSAKDKYDSKTLIPVLENYFSLHPEYKYKYFLGDAGFDSCDNYEYLIKDKNISPIIPLNPRNQSNLPKPNFTPEGIPTCPHYSTLEMKFDGITREKGRSDRLKYICPKSKKYKIDGHTAYKVSCNNRCTKSKCGRIVQICINSNYRLNTPVPRNTQRWNDLYKIRTICERTISQLKICFNSKYSFIRNTNSMKTNILFAAITQLVTVILAYKSNDFSKIKSIKSLIA
ncbi:transposase, partial [Intestinibacter sp.]|uniref:transposase n=1 Tax=Intestinibacter sp. TaxID=1965304 RepID=UPI002A74F845